ncbi:MAG: glycosyltransferase [Bacteroides sp.]|nr:glycosyltransferase [Bacteroides sp.]
MAEKNQKITVVTVCYNAVNEIEKTIQSVINQTYPDMEYIIMDGGSTDGTVDIIRKYADRIDYWVSERDGGIYEAMTKGIEHATGDYINFMNAGDTFFDNRVLEEVFAGRHYEEDVIYGSNLNRYKGGYKSFHPSPIDVMPGSMPFCHQSTFTKTSVLREHPFDRTFRRVADYIFFRNLYENGGTFRRVPRYISVYDEYGFSSTINKDAYDEMCRAFGWKPSLKSYLGKRISASIKGILYSRLKFMIYSRRKPGKYGLDRKHFSQLTEKF